MKVLLFDSTTNTTTGEIEVPDDVIEAARKVERWMTLNVCTELCGLKICSALVRDAMDASANFHKERRLT